MKEDIEQVLLDSFRCYRGKGYYLGVKSPWWAKNVTDEEQTVGLVKVLRWTPTVQQLTIADILLFDIMLRLSVADRLLIVKRCGTGFKRSFRKCGRDVGLHHEVFRQEYQRVIQRVQILLDEMAKNKA